MRFRPLITFLEGSAFFAVLPVFAPPVVLQTDEIPRFLLGLGAAAVAGVALYLSAGTTLARGLGLVLMCVFVGSVLYTVLYAVPTFGSGEPPRIWPSVVVFTSAYTGVPAAVGAVLAGSTRAFVARLRR